MKKFIEFFNRRGSLQGLVLGIGAGLVLLVVLVLWLLFQLEEHHLNQSRTMQLAHRQNISSQQMVKELLLLARFADDDHLKQFLTTVRVFDDTLTGLRQGSSAPTHWDQPDGPRTTVYPQSPDVLSQLEQVEAIWRPLHQVLSTTDLKLSSISTSDTLLVRHNRQLLQTMNQTVALMGKKFQQHGNSLILFVKWGAAIGVLGLLLLSWIVHIVKRQIDNIAKHMENFTRGLVHTHISEPGVVQELRPVVQGGNALTDHLTHLLRMIAIESGTIEKTIADLVASQECLGEDRQTGRGMDQEIMDGTQDATHEITNSIQELRKTTVIANEEINAAFTFTRGLTENIQNIAQTTEDASQSICIIATEAEMTTMTVGQVNTSLDDVNQSVITVSARITEVNHGMERVQSLSRSAGSSATKAGEKVQEAAEVMSRLAISAGEISDVLELINDIADQVNMLALNASIEAASAGNVGKGFAVVADEIKALAQQIAKATNRIEDNIWSIQKDSKEAADAVSQITTVFEELFGFSEETSLSVHKQTQAIGKIDKAVTDVAKAAEEVTNQAKEMEETAKEVFQTATEAAENTNRVAREAAEAAKFANEELEKRNQARNTMLQSIAQTETAIDQSIQQIADKMDQARKLNQFLQNSANHVHLILQQVSAFNANLQETGQKFVIEEESTELKGGSHI